MGYVDPDWLLEQELDAEERGQNDVVLKENMMLKSVVEEEKKKNAWLTSQLVKHETELAFQDQLIEEQEAMLRTQAEEGKKKWKRSKYWQWQA